MPNKKKICVITGTRADYGILLPLLKEIENSPKLDLTVLITGMHFLRKFGTTYKEVEKDGFKSVKVKLSSMDGAKNDMAQAVGEAIIKIAAEFKKQKPDLVVVLGDRGEMLAAAITCNYLDIPVAHIHGGEISGHVDGVVRHAITKLSHLHFTATLEAKKRILKMGEEDSKVFNSGAPGLDSILSEKLPSKEELASKYHLKKNLPLIILIQHPVLSELDKTASNMQQILAAVLSFKFPSIIIYPNADYGSEEIISEIKKRKASFVSVYKSIPHKDFLGLLKIAAVLVGNSSSGIIEAASFKLPVVNVGSRQNGRERGKNVISVSYNIKEIRDALIKIFNHDKGYFLRLKNLRNPYGDGNASKKIRKVIEEVDLEELKHKKIAY